MSRAAHGAQIGIERHPLGWSAGMVKWLAEPAVIQRLQLLGSQFTLGDFARYQPDLAVARIIRQLCSERHRPAFIAWVLVLGLSGRYPTRTQVRSVAGPISHGRFGWALRYALTVSTNTQARRRILVPAPSLVVDVTKLASQETISGIPRVTLALAKEAMSGGGQAIVWDSAGPARVTISAEGDVEFPSDIWARPQNRRRQLMRLYLQVLKSLSVNPGLFVVAAAVVRGLLTLGLRWTRVSKEPRELLLLAGAHYVESEIPSAEVAEQLGLTRQMGVGLSVTVVVHDFLPVTHPEYFDDGSVREHLALTELLCESDSACVATPELADQVVSATALMGNNTAPQVSVIPLPMPLPSASSARAEPSEPYFLVMGGFGSRKGVSEFLDYLAMCGHSLEQFEIRVVGFPRPSRNGATIELYRRLRRWGVDVSFNPSDTELAELMENSLGVVYPSFAEGYGFPVLEATYRDKPVICRPIPSNQSLQAMCGGRFVYWDDRSKSAYDTMVRLAHAPDSDVVARTPGRIPIPTDTTAWARTILWAGHQDTARSSQSSANTPA